MLKYWSNVFAMLGVALVATAFFKAEDWHTGTILGVYFICIGAGLYNGLDKGKGK